VRDDVSVGFYVDYTNRSSTGLQANGTKVTYDTSSGSMFGRIGGHVALSEELSWYLTAGFGVGLRSGDERAGVARNQSSASVLWLGLSAPLLVHVAQHYFIGFGPFLSYDLSADYSGGDNRATSLGASTVVGGWL
jgi:hypothetical protein